MKEDIFDPWYFYSKRYKHWGWLYILLLLIPIFIILAITFKVVSMLVTDEDLYYKQEIYDNFHPLPVKEVPLFSEEMCGMAALERLKDTLYQDEDPAQVYYKENTIKVVQESSNNYSLELYLPGIPKEQIQLNKTGDELNIRIGNHRRNLVLPQALASLNPKGAKMEDDYLKIKFADVVNV